MSRRTEKVGAALRKAGVKARKAGGKVRAEIKKRRLDEKVVTAGKVMALVGAEAIAFGAEAGARAIRRGVAKQLDKRGLYIEVDLPLPPEGAVARVTEALSGVGFGILTRIDVAQTLRDKLGVTFRPYVILGACNPPLAHQALTARPEAGLFLPCNVTVESDGHGGSVVRIANPEMVLGGSGLERDPELRRIATEARTKLERAAMTLRDPALLTSGGQAD